MTMAGNLETEDTPTSAGLSPFLHMSLSPYGSDFDFTAEDILDFFSSPEVSSFSPSIAPSSGEFGETPRSLQDPTASPFYSPFVATPSTGPLSDVASPDGHGELHLLTSQLIGPALNKTPSIDEISSTVSSEWSTGFGSSQQSLSNGGSSDASSPLVSAAGGGDQASPHTLAEDQATLYTHNGNASSAGRDPHLPGLTERPFLLSFNPAAELVEAHESLLSSSELVNETATAVRAQVSPMYPTDETQSRTDANVSLDSQGSRQIFTGFPHQGLNSSNSISQTQWAYASVPSSKVQVPITTDAATTIRQLFKSPGDFIHRSERYRTKDSRVDNVGENTLKGVKLAEGIPRQRYYATSPGRLLHSSTAVAADVSSLSGSKQYPPPPTNTIIESDVCRTFTGMPATLPPNNEIIQASTSQAFRYESPNSVQISANPPIRWVQPSTNNTVQVDIRQRIHRPKRGKDSCTGTHNNRTRRESSAVEPSSVIPRAGVDISRQSDRPTTPIERHKKRAKLPTINRSAQESLASNSAFQLSTLTGTQKPLGNFGQTMSGDSACEWGDNGESFDYATISHEEASSAPHTLQNHTVPNYNHLTQYLNLPAADQSHFTSWPPGYPNNSNNSLPNALNPSTMAIPESSNAEIGVQHSSYHMHGQHLTQHIHFIPQREETEMVLGNSAPSNPHLPFTHHFDPAIHWNPVYTEGWMMNHCLTPEQVMGLLPHSEEVSNENREIGTEGNTSGPVKRPRQPFTPSQREGTHSVRLRGACVRCHYLRERCDMGNPCGRCKDVAGKQKTWMNMPCVVMRITEAELFRRGNSKFNQRSAAILPLSNWKQGARKVLTLGRPPLLANEFWGQNPHPIFRISVKEFIPDKTHLLHETWRGSDGTEHQIMLPPFAVEDIGDLKQAYSGFIRDSFELYKNDMVRGQQDPLVRLVFREAIRWVEQQSAESTSMLLQALKIWVICRSISEGIGIIGEETYNIPMDTNPESPYFGTVPIPPILDHQIDTLGIKLMISLKDKLLKALSAKIEKRKQSQWYEIFLTIFVLLCNLETVWQEQNRYVKRHENTVTGIKAGIRYLSQEWMGGWEMAAKVLLTHFRVALKGAVPFSFNWEGNITEAGELGKAKSKGKRKTRSDPVTDAKERAGMDDEAVNFMRHLCRLLKEREMDFNRLKSDYERSRYDVNMIWVSQIFFDG